MIRTGTVAKVVGTKGFGFITPSTEGSDDLFFHASATVPRELFDTLTAGAAVTYEFLSETSDGRPRAVNVQLAAG
jgi:cold shock CspA family protein